MNRTLRLTRNFMLLFASIWIFLMMTIEPSWAANHFIRAGASGNKSGADWTNACTGFAGSCAVASLVRGDTYYVATGNYAAVVFNTAASGTSVITVKGATASDHGTSTGWLAAYGVDVTQATFSYGNDSAIKIETSYWTIDGNTGSGSSSSAYGFLINKPSDCTSTQQRYVYVRQSDGTTSSQTAITVKHIAANACGSSFNVGQAAISFGCGQCYLTNSTFANSFFDGFQVVWSGTNTADSIIEYNWSQNAWSSSAQHGATYRMSNCHSLDGGACTGLTTACTQGLCANNNTFRYNNIRNCKGTACIEWGDPGNHDSNPNFKIYGNVFYDKPDGGNGVIATASMATNYMHNAKIYNNTFIDMPGTIIHVCESDCSGATGNEFKNNILYNSSSILNAGRGTLTHDYNAYISAIDVPPAETHGQIGSIDPFVDYASGNYRLVDGASIYPGANLGDTYSSDMDLKVRGADGKWDIGAFEFAGTYRPPSPPNNLRVF